MLGGPTALLGGRDLTTHAIDRVFEVIPTAGGRGVPCGLKGVVVVELALGLARHVAQDAHVAVGHALPPPRSGTGIDTATACSGDGGTSSSLKTLNPSVPSRLDA
ncbi:MAG TPA: hypothetical protein VFH80_28375 [Solirubrobacteraceae bacterium]|nr:hypothetical protein [Solirubrobacteraceae bacterium]